MVQAVEGLLPMIDANTVVVSGHGAAADRTTLLGFRDMLRKIEDRILARSRRNSKLARSCRPNPGLMSGPGQ
jgi:hypothetical protein